MRTLTRWIWALVAAGAVAMIPVWGLGHEHHATAPAPTTVSTPATAPPAHTAAPVAGIVAVVLVGLVVAGLLGWVWVASRRGVGRVVPMPPPPLVPVRRALPPGRPRRTLDEQLRDSVGG